ncbi:Exodeoxyribonuclease III [Alteromonadaceae bacterium Bs31]|nr:Exodeoxyribonuclease III [Alteromonadaceae bacterium Bs31]
MLCVSFNANSLRTRLHQVDEIIEKYRPDFIGIQETKVTDENFPQEELSSWGYHLAFTGQKTHYGVALLSRHPFEHVQKGFPSDSADAQKRFIAATVKVKHQTVTVMNGYFPQGENSAHPVKYPLKRQFYADLQSYLEQHHKPDQAIILMGDLNIAPTDLDVGMSESDAKRWLSAGSCSFLAEEREWFNRLISWGFEDTYRLLNENTEEYSWFDYRTRGFDRSPKRGLRIDFVLSTPALSHRCIDSGIDLEIRAMEKPSDHCPVWAEFD